MHSVALTMHSCMAQDFSRLATCVRTIRASDTEQCNALILCSVNSVRIFHTSTRKPESLPVVAERCSCIDLDGLQTERRVLKQDSEKLSSRTVNCENRGNPLSGAGKIGP